MHPRVIAQRRAGTNRAIAEALSTIEPEGSDHGEWRDRLARGTGTPAANDPLRGAASQDEAIAALAVALADQQRRIEELEGK